MKIKTTFVAVILPLVVLGLVYFLSNVSYVAADKNKVGKREFAANLVFKKTDGATSTSSAKLNVNLKKNGLYETIIRMKFNDIVASSSYNYVYEGWLVDTATTTGYKLSLGGFITNNEGKGEFNFNQTMVNFTVYDKLVITREAVNDPDLSPSTTVLEADIPASFPTVTYQAKLLGSNEVPSNTSTASGTGAFVIDTTKNTMTFNISFAGLAGTETGAHIHGPASSGATAGVLFTLPSGSPKTGTWTYDQSLESKILAGQTYINIHSSSYPDGEIRGQIVP